MTRKEIKDLATMIARMAVDLTDEILTAQKAAELLGWSVRTVYNQKDILGGWKWGKKLYFSRKAIENKILSGRGKQEDIRLTD